MAVLCPRAQTDKKTLNTKVMMQEMKEIREKRRSAETTAKAVSVQTPFVFPLNPDITFNCQDEWGCLPSSPQIYSTQCSGHDFCTCVSCCNALRDPSEVDFCHQMSGQGWLPTSSS